MHGHRTTQLLSETYTFQSTVHSMSPVPAESSFAPCNPIDYYHAMPYASFLNNKATVTLYRSIIIWSVAWVKLSIFSEQLCMSTILLICYTNTLFKTIGGCIALWLQWLHMCAIYIIISECENYPLQQSGTQNLYTKYRNARVVAQISPVLWLSLASQIMTFTEPALHLYSLHSNSNSTLWLTKAVY